MPPDFSHPEDQMQAAVALTERVELQPRGGADTVVAGYRRDGRLSLYFGEDPYYQFDPQGRLRRAFVGGRLFRTEGSGLAALTRERTAEATELIRRDLDPGELDVFLQAMLGRIEALRAGLACSDLRVVRQVPAEVLILGRLAESLDSILSAAGALAPAINRMR
jgi:hypothetical protein